MAKKKKEIIQDNSEEKQPKKRVKKVLKLKRKTKTTKKKKTRRKFGPIEFSFNFISLIFAMGVALFYGGRSFYYYSLQSQSKKESAMTIAGLLMDNNTLMKENEEGFHKADDGYYFRGHVENNYVWYANRMFRVLRINEDNSVKMVSNDLVASFMWGDTPNYDQSNVRLWLTKTDQEHSGVYYDTIPSPNKNLTKIKYTIDRLLETKVEFGDQEFEDYVTSLTLNDYVVAGGKSSYLNNGKLFFLLGYNSDNENIYVEEDGSIVSCDSLDGFGIRSVIQIVGNTHVLQGDGTKDNPYMIDQGNDINYVDSYVKLGNDTWKVFEDKNGLLKMYLNGYIKIDGNDVMRMYSYNRNRFDYYNEANLGYYLNNDYLNSLSYNALLVANDYPNGEISAEMGYSFMNTYNDHYNGRVSLLDIFSYVSNNDINNFFRGNTGASMSTRQYSVLENGMVEEAEVSSSKPIVPVVSISTDSIKGGTGRMDDPYVLE